MRTFKFSTQEGVVHEVPEAGPCLTCGGPHPGFVSQMLFEAMTGPGTRANHADVSPRHVELTFPHRRAPSAGVRAGWHREFLASQRRLELAS